MNWMLLDIWEAETQIISEFWVIGKLQYYEIYSKLNRRNKWWSSGQLSNNNLDNETDYSYLCNGNNNCREIINLLTTILCSCKPTCKPDLLRV